MLLYGDSCKRNHIRPRAASCPTRSQYSERSELLFKKNSGIYDLRNLMKCNWEARAVANLSNPPKTGVKRTSHEIRRAETLYRATHHTLDRVRRNKIVGDDVVFGGSNKITGGSSAGEDASRSNSINLHRPRFGRRQPKSGRCRLRFGRRQPKSGRRQPKSGRRQPKSGRCRPRSGRRQPKSNRCRPNFGRRQPKPGRCRPNFGRRPLKSGRRQPKLGRRHAKFGRRRQQLRRCRRLGQGNDG